MAITYSTVTKVQNQIQNIDTSIKSAMIEEYICMAEGLINATMGKSFIIPLIFSSTKHQLIERTATKLAAIDCVLYDITHNLGTSGSSLVLYVLRADSNRCLDLLKNPAVVKFLEGETK